jgi:hypothetical protein
MMERERNGRERQGEVSKKEKKIRNGRRIKNRGSFGHLE